MASKALLASKIVIFEEEPRIRSVPALQTAVWAVIGVTEKGPVNEPTLITSADEFEAIFGGFTSDAKDVPAAVRGYFQNRGQFCVVVRTTHYTDILDPNAGTELTSTVTLDDKAAVPNPTIQIDAISPGLWGDDLRITIEDPSNQVDGDFTLIVKNSEGALLESWVNLSMDVTSDQYFLKLINAEIVGSQYVVTTDLASPEPPPDNRPLNIVDAPLLGGLDGLIGLVDVDFIGDVVSQTGLFALDRQEFVTLLSIPGRSSSGVQNAIVTYAEDRESIFAILDPPTNTTAVGMLTYINTTTSLNGLTERAAIYWPRIKIVNPNTNLYGTDERIVIPPSGHIAGVFARTDNFTIGGIYIPPAGVERGIIFGAAELEVEEVKDEVKRDLVYPNRINPITTLNGVPIHIDGTHTLKANGNFPSVSERRGVIFIEQTIKAALQFVRHSNNDARLRQTVARTVTAFLIDQMNVGAFRTRDPATAFFVDFGEGINTIQVQRAGQLKGRIGLATQTPIDWVILSFSRDTRAEEELLALATQ